MSVTVPPPPGADCRARRASRQELANVLWRPDGSRRLPAERQLAGALAACRQDDAWWVCEASSAGPVYLLPTREWVTLLARYITRLGARRVLEIAAGDGFLSACLAKRVPAVSVIATDSGAWTRAARRMSAADQREFAGVSFAGVRPGENVSRLAATTAVARFRPDLVLVAWAPPGVLVERAIRGPCRFVLDVGVEGDICGNGARTWRFRKDFVEGPLESRALCRLDGGGGAERRTRLCLYYGRRHRLHGLE